jgi:SOS-response transcriptional repressor LexA
MLLPLTQIQNDVFVALQGYVEQHGYPPTIPELSEKVGKKNVGGELVALRKKGWATKIEGHGKRSTIPSDEALDKVAESKQGNLKI